MKRACAECLEKTRAGLKVGDTLHAECYDAAVYEVYPWLPVFDGDGNAVTWIDMGAVVEK